MHQTERRVAGGQLNPRPVPAGKTQLGLFMQIRSSRTCFAVSLLVCLACAVCLSVGEWLVVRRPITASYRSLKASHLFRHCRDCIIQHLATESSASANTEPSLHTMRTRKLHCTSASRTSIYLIEAKSCGSAYSNKTHHKMNHAAVLVVYLPGF